MAVLTPCRSQPAGESFRSTVIVSGHKSPAGQLLQNDLVPGKRSTDRLFLCNQQQQSLGFDEPSAILPSDQPFFLTMYLRRVCLCVALALPSWPALAQAPVFRCGNEYTNDARQAEQRLCQVLELGPVTVPGTQVMRPAAPAPVPVLADKRSAASAEPRLPQSNPQTRIDAAVQRSRDADARQILEAELLKAQTRLAQTQAEFKQGEPDKQGPEGRNHQRYLDRVQAMRSELVRQQADVTSLQRELARLPSAAVASTP